jgi:2-polyprenyl-3-methyl-5-hydroxy-6-metoxy-1,4-benzoquinol methylase
MKCNFCSSTSLKLLYTKKYHLFKKDHGPFDFYICNNCKSGITYPLPSKLELEKLYQSFEGGMNKTIRNLRENHPLDKWYNQCVNQALMYHKNKYDKYDKFTWIDIGAGNGEIAIIMKEMFPNSIGYAVDFHTEPNSLKSLDINWVQCDLNDEAFYQLIGQVKFDIVLSITVLEHVLNPAVFLSNMFQLINKDGSIYITVPDYSSTMSKVLKRFWPYLIFGEHLNIPSINGMKKLSINSLNLTDLQKEIIVKSIILPYSVVYYLDFLKLSLLTKFFSNKHFVKINTGILELSIS